MPPRSSPIVFSKISAIWFCDGFMRAGMMFRIGSETKVNSVSILIGVGRILSITPASTVICLRTSASLKALRYPVAGSLAGPE